ncbi:hypothetical protein BH23VER1_BH23VER1_07650 [soil metagenome]
MGASSKRPARKAPAKAASTPTATPRSRRGGGNRRTKTPAVRDGRGLAKSIGHRVTVAQAREPFTVPVTWLKAGFGVVLAPVCLVTALAFFDTFTAAAIDRGLWKAAELWYFALGVLLWLISFFTLPRPLTAYVLGHELTHAFFVIVCGGRIRDFHFDRRGGFVVTDRNNTLISLSPYFVPFYTVMAMLAFGLVTPFVDVTHLYANAVYGIASFKWTWLLFALVGFTWAFHLTFTVWMIGKDQPDLRENGVFFSLVLIFLVNLLVVAGGLIVASPETTLDDFAASWTANASGIWLWMQHAAASALAR